MLVSPILSFAILETIGRVSSHTNNGAKSHPSLVRQLEVGILRFEIFGQLLNAIHEGNQREIKSTIQKQLVQTD
jgi:hypothetical protein